MAALDFPNSPTVGQTYAGTNGVNYQWDGTVWTVPLGGAQLWVDTGTALTPTVSTRNLDVPSGVLYLEPGGRLVTVANLHQASINEVGIPGQDTTKPAWRWGANASVDALFADRALANTTNFVRLLTLDGTTSPPGNLTITGNTATKATGTTWSNPSDPRLKQDVAPYAAGLVDICQLAPITYRLKSQPDGPLCYGFDAEKVRDVFPECVSTTKMKLNPEDEEETDDVLTFDMHPILVAVVNALKQVETRLAALEAR